jgi:thioesterase domain-containing protein/acyl-CoA synthetase (AMP-forming)/AMP-acid ligase II/acyl carrier protein
MGSPGIYRNPDQLIETITRYQVTSLQCVPTLLQALLETELLHACTSLTQIFCGGEALTRSLARRCLEALPGCELVNLYGPTECTINSSACTVDRNRLGDGAGTVPIGTPVDETRYDILDAQRRPVAAGEIGELYIGGIQLARGYLHRPELTAEKFVSSADASGAVRLFKTGDLAHWNADGTVQFCGRSDNQVKLRGFRVELDEIRLAIEAHDWVKHAGVAVTNDPRTGFQYVLAFVELNPKEAALMDQGNHDAHHQSKASRHQVRAQLSNAGCRDGEALRGRPVIELPGATPSAEQRRRAFARKTYRFYEGRDAITEADLLRLLGRRARGSGSRSPDQLSLAELGELLRYFGPYVSDERMLPKYGYASPGSLYATQMYFELNQIAGLQPGLYYYHPIRHELIQLRVLEGSARPLLGIHFIGKRSAIEPVYKHNLQEVLEIEAGHMVGLYEEILPAYGLGITDREFTPAVKDALDCRSDDYYLGSFELVPRTAAGLEDALEIYVQAHPGRVADLPAGQYAYREGALHKISDELILKQHVIAINQRVYARASFGISVIARTARSWRSYLDLGRGLQRLSMNELDLGFMSSGYSSRTGHELRSAERIASILRGCGRDAGPSYFFVGGRISEEQRTSEGMKEDTVHMQGPAEMIREDLGNLLPDYMVPNRVVVVDRMPLSANGKLDVQALAAMAERLQPAARPFVAPRTATERQIATLWCAQMRRDSASVHDEFFESGGNSLIAVGLINKINRQFGCTLPLQVVFESPTIEQLARRVDAQLAEPSSRLVRLDAGTSGPPRFCWPGLGGFTMNLRALAVGMGGGRPFYGVQAHGINDAEVPYASLEEMAAEDIKVIRRLQPRGPYALWGYSFGARVAIEVARQLERAGERVEQVLLLAPGSPEISAHDGSTRASEPSYRNTAYVTILFSVFAGSITDPALVECLQVARDDDSFAAFIAGRFPDLDSALIKRVIKVVQTTYRFGYTPAQLTSATLAAPVTIFPARGDERSVFETVRGYSAEPPSVIELGVDHYRMLKHPEVDGLTAAIRRRLGRASEIQMPHVNIKYFPVSLSDTQ